MYDVSNSFCWDFIKYTVLYSVHIRSWPTRLKHTCFVVHVIVTTRALLACPCHDYTHYTHYTHYTLHTLHYTVHITHSTLYTLYTHYTLHTTHYTLHTTHCTLHTTHYTLHTTHYSLHTTHYINTHTIAQAAPSAAYLFQYHIS